MFTNQMERHLRGTLVQTLKRVLNEMKELGFSNFNLGPEPEFFLFKLDEKGEPTLEGNDQGSYFDLAPIDLGEECRREIVLN